MEFKNTNIIVHKDLTPISAKITSELKKTEKNGNVLLSSRKLLSLCGLVKKFGQKLYKVQKWDNEGF